MEKVKYDFGKGYIQSDGSYNWCLIERKAIKDKNGVEKEVEANIGYYGSLEQARFGACEKFGKRAESHKELLEACKAINNSVNEK